MNINKKTIWASVGVGIFVVIMVVIVVLNKERYTLGQAYGPTTGPTTPTAPGEAVTISDNCYNSDGSKGLFANWKKEIATAGYVVAWHGPPASVIAQGTLIGGPDIYILKRPGRRDIPIDQIDMATDQGTDLNQWQYNNWHSDRDTNTGNQNMLNSETPGTGDGTIQQELPSEFDDQSSSLPNNSYTAQAGTPPPANSEPTYFFHLEYYCKGGKRAEKEFSGLGTEEKGNVQTIPPGIAELAKIYGVYGIFKANFAIPK